MKHRFIKAIFVVALAFSLSIFGEVFASAASTNNWKSVASMPQEREFFQTAIIDGKIYVIGGHNTSGVMSSMFEYDPTANVWTQRASMSIARDFFKAVVINKKIYAVGGNFGDNSNIVEEYDPSTDKWIVKSPSPVQISCCGAEVIGNKLYVIGGGTSSTEMYDPENDKWTQKASMSTNRDFLQTEVIGGKIYAIGGQSGGVLASVEEYDPNTDKWTPRASMKAAREEFCTEVVDNKIYALGGNYSPTYTSFLSSVEEYDPQTNTWTTKAPMSDLRWRFATANINGNIYAMGGAYPLTSSFEMYDPHTNKWVSKAPMNTIRASFNIAVLKNKIYAIGGWNNHDGQLTSVESYSENESAPTLTVTASPNKVKVGQQFTTDIAIHNETNICAEDIKLTYDKDLFEYEGATGQTGTKIYKEDASTPGTIRFITACQGKDTAATGDKGLITLKFKAKAKGVGKVDIIKGRIADNATLEEDMADENCGEDTITVDGYQDVNRSGNFTLLDLGIDAYYDGMNASDTDSTKYDADVIPDGKIDDSDLTQITQEILANKEYAPNNN